MLGLRKPNFKTKIIHFEKSHNAENCKRGLFEILNIHSFAKFQKIEGGPFGYFFSKKKQKMRSFKSHSAEKSERRDPLGFFNIRSVAKTQKNGEEPLGIFKKFRKVSQSRKGGSRKK